MTRIFFTHLVKKDLLIETKGVAIKEWWVADKHLEENGSHAPPVYSLIVAALAKDFWSDVVRCSHSRVGQLSRALILLSLVVQVAVHVAWIAIIWVQIISA